MPQHQVEEGLALGQGALRLDAFRELHVDEDDAGDRPGQSETVEHPRHVDVDRHRREGLRQQEQDHQRRAPRQPEARQRIAGRDRDGERHQNR